MKTQPLLSAISTILPAVNAKGLVPEFQFLYFHKDYVEATDGSLLLRAQLEEEMPEFCVEAGVFHQLLKTVTAEEVEIRLKDKSVVLKAKGLKTKLNLPAEVPECDIDFDVDDWTEVPDGLLEGLSLCRFTACPDQTAGPLTGVRVEEDTVISCDRWRVSLFSLEKAFGHSVTIPVNIIDQLGRFPKIEGFAIKDSTIYFDADTARIGAKLLLGEYPSEPLLGQLDQIKDAEELKLTKELKGAISDAGKRQNIIQSKMLEFDRETEFTVDKGKVKLSAQSEAIGAIEETLDCKKAKKASFTFRINPVFLLKSFAETDTLLYSEPNNIAAFEGNNFMHLVKTKTPDEDK